MVSKPRKFLGAFVFCTGLVAGVLYSASDVQVMWYDAPIAGLFLAGVLTIWVVQKPRVGAFLAALHAVWAGVAVLVLSEAYLFGWQLESFRLFGVATFGICLVGGLYYGSKAVWRGAKVLRVKGFSWISRLRNRRLVG